MPKKTNTQRELEALQMQVGALFEQTEGVPGDTLAERIEMMFDAMYVKPTLPPPDWLYGMAQTRRVGETQ